MVRNRGNSSLNLILQGPLKNTKLNKEQIICKTHSLLSLEFSCSETMKKQGKKRGRSRKEV